MRFLTTIAGGPGTATPVRSWQLQSSSSNADVGAESGPVVSLPEFRAAGWYIAAPRSTVMGALVDHGEYPDVLFGTRLATMDGARFTVPWWFRTTFTFQGGGRTAIRVTGVIPVADLWVNGTRVAATDRIAGAYRVEEFDVTPLLQGGDNALALLVHPGNPMDDLSIGWVDWNAWPPDNNMGPWRDVFVVRTGDVSLSPPHVTSHRRAGDRAGGREDSKGPVELNVAVEVHNRARESRTVRLAGEITGDGIDPPIRIDRELSVAGGESETVLFASADSPGLEVDEAPIWWPVGEGEQPLCHLQLTATCGGVLSDGAGTTFGIRTVDSHVAPGGGRQFVINGRPIQIRAAGWAPDIFLRHDAGRLRDELSYARHMGLNAIRLEGKLENPEFFDAADRLGLMVLPGWECCDKWEAWAGTGGAPWDDGDYEVAAASMKSEAVLLRNHPSVVAFLIGSDFAPPPRLAQLYADALDSAGWDLPVVASATFEGTEATGPSGMKMTGPYEWVPPVYWYDRNPKRGGAVGFNSETSPGHSVPRLPSLRTMLSDEELDALWQDPERRQPHSGPPSVFDNLAVFSQALSGRYGPPASLADYVRKAQLANYEMTRALFEAFGARDGCAEPATGVVYWMLNNAWPGLNWHLFDWFLDPAGAYFGARKANEPVHAQYDYAEGTVSLINKTIHDVGPVTVTARVRLLDGTVAWEQHGRCDLLHPPPQPAAVVLRVERPASVAGTYFLELEWVRPGGEGGTPSRDVGRNVYWLSTTEDVLDWDATTWHYTPTSQYANLRGLQLLRSARVEVTTDAGDRDGIVSVKVGLRNTDPAGTPAVGLHASVVSLTSSRPVGPILWDDNDVTLFASQAVLLQCSYPESALEGSKAAIQLEGFNVRGARRIPLM